MNDLNVKSDAHVKVKIGKKRNQHYKIKLPIL